MDPGSVIGVIGVVSQIIKAIYKYGDSVSECKTEVARLRAELFGIQAALTQVERDLSASSDNGPSPLTSSNLRSQESLRVLEAARTLLEPLAEALTEGITRSDRLTKRLVWPFKRQSVRDIATHLERLKTYFILAATNDTLQATKETAESLERLHLLVKETSGSEKQRVEESKAYRWLDPFDPTPAHNAALSAHMEGTGGWFLDGIFKKWVLGDSRFLWLNGQPGSGKTCLMAASVKRTLDEPQNGIVAYFYCSFNDAESQEPRNIVTSLLSQLFRQDSLARDLIIHAHRKCLAKRSGLPGTPELPELVNLIREVCVELSRPVYFFVDAVDECAEEPETTLQTLVGIASGIGTVKVAFSSTERVARLIQQSLTPLRCDVTEVRIHLEDVKYDINAYIEWRFRGEKRLAKLGSSTQVQVKVKLGSEHQGSFRWVQCTMDDLSRLTTPRAVKSALQSITPSLSDNYKAILTAIPHDIADISHAMLVYLVSSSRQLTLAELAEASVYTSSDEFCEDDRLIEPEAVISYLRSLIRYDPFTTKVELAHSSVRDFLTTPERSGKYYIDPVVAMAAISRVCVEYLANPAFRWLCPDDEAISQRKEDWPFFEYASLFWTRHVQALGLLPHEVKAAISRLVASADVPSEGNWASWYQCVYPDGDPEIWATSPLYMCAREGLTHVLEDILETCDRWTIDKPGGARESTPLHVAATYGRLEAVKALLTAGADPNDRNGFGDAGIQWAAYGGHEDIVQELLKWGADPELLNKPIYYGIYQYED